MSRLTATRRIEIAILNGGPAVLVHAEPGGLIGARFIEPATDGCVEVIRWVRNPDRLSR